MKKRRNIRYIEWADRPKKRRSIREVVGMPMQVSEPQPPRVFVSRTMGAASVTERKYFTTGLTSTAVVSAVNWAGTELDPAANCLFYPQEGADIDNRIGRRVTIKKITVRGYCACQGEEDTSTAHNAQAIRIVLYMDMQTNGAQSQGEELLANPTVATAANAMNTFQNTSNFGRFKVLKDKMMIFGNRSAAQADIAASDKLTVQGQGRVFKMSYRFLKPLVVRFNGTNGGTVADIIDNSFHILANSSSDENGVLLSYECRVVYTDN